MIRIKKYRPTKAFKKEKRSCVEHDQTTIITVTTTILVIIAEIIILTVECNKCRTQANI